MESNDLSNLGEEIKNIVQDAIGTMDFHKLNKDIGDTINSAMKEVKKTMQDTMTGNTGGHAAVNIQKKENKILQQASRTKDYKNTSKVIRDRNGRFRKIDVDPIQKPIEKGTKIEKKAEVSVQNPNRPAKALVTTRPAGRIKKVVFGTLGAVGSFSFGIAYVSIFGVMLTQGGEPGLLLALIILFPFLTVSIWMLAKACRIGKRLNRYYQYVNRMHGRTYCTIKELASQVGKSEKFVLKDVRKMIELRMFPDGRIDEEEKFLILNHETYVQYIQAQRMMEQKRVEEEDRTQKIIEQEDNMNKDPLLEQVKEALVKKENYIAQIRKANDEIKGADISKKLDALEAIISKIFKHLEEHPEKLPEMRKFMDYYLPTTLKLVNVYCEFDKQVVEGDHIIKAKKEIEDTLDTINKAFINLFDNLFADVAMDISTDISVLETMLKQEGLTKSDFE